MDKSLDKHIGEAMKLTELMAVFSEKSLPNNQGEFLVIHQKIVEFCEKLFKKYGYKEVIKRKLFHIVAGSSGLTNAEVPFLDFEGEDSIEKFIREL